MSSCMGSYKFFTLKFLHSYAGVRNFSDFEWLMHGAQWNVSFVCNDDSLLNI